MAFCNIFVTCYQTYFICQKIAIFVSNLITPSQISPFRVSLPPPAGRVGEGLSGRGYGEGSLIQKSLDAPLRCLLKFLVENSNLRYLRVTGKLRIERLQIFTHHLVGIFAVLLQ